MEFINKIEILGIVGNSSIQKVGDTRLCRFSVAVDHAYRDNSGTNIIETTWFPVSAFSGPGICNLDSITRGSIVHVIGRLKCNRYVDANGNDRVQYELVARKLEIINQEDRI